MRGVALYVAVATPFLAIPLVLLPFGVAPDDGLGIALVAAAVSSVVATLYVRRRYLASPEPRSVFWGFLVSAIEIKAAFGVWIGYLVAATLLIGTFVLPIPDPATRITVNAFAGIFFLVSAVYYAVAIWLLGRQVSS